MGKEVTELNQEEIKNLVLDTSKIIKVYVDKQDEAVRGETQEALSALETKLQNQLDLIAKIDDADGVNTLAEKLKAVQEALKNGDALIEVQNRFVAVEGALSDLTSRVKATEDGLAGLGVKIDNNKKAVVDLGAKVTADIKTASDEVLTEAKAYTDSIAPTKLDLSGVVSEIEDLFGVKLNSDANAL